MKQCSHHDNLLTTQNLNCQPSQVCYIHFHQKITKAGSARTCNFDSHLVNHTLALYNIPQWICFLSFPAFSLLADSLAMKWQYVAALQYSYILDYCPLCLLELYHCWFLERLSVWLLHRLFCSLLLCCHIHNGKILFCLLTQHKNLSKES